VADKDKAVETTSWIEGTKRLDSKPEISLTGTDRFQTSSS